MSFFIGVFFCNLYYFKSFLRYDGLLLAKENMVKILFQKQLKINERKNFVDNKPTSVSI